MTLDRYAHDTITTQFWVNEALAENYHALDAAALTEKLPNPPAGSGGLLNYPKFSESEAYDFMDNRKAGLGVTYSNTDSDWVQVAVDKFPSKDYAIGEEDFVYNVTHFQEQFMAPGGRAVARFLNRMCLDLRKFAVNYVVMDADQDASLAVVDAAFAVSDQGVDTGNFAGWYAPRYELALRKDESIRSAERSADGGRLLRQNVVGNIAGIPGYGIGMIRDGVSMIAARKGYGGIITQNAGSSARSEFPIYDSIRQGVFTSAVAEYQGLNLRVTGERNGSQKGYGISIDVLAGSGILDKQKACLIVPPGTTKQQLVDAGYSEELVDRTPKGKTWAVGGDYTRYDHQTVVTDTTTTEKPGFADGSHPEAPTGHNAGTALTVKRFLKDPAEGGDNGGTTPGGSSTVNIPSGS